MSNPILIGPIIGQIDLNCSTAIILATFDNIGKYIYEIIPDDNTCITIKKKFHVKKRKMPIRIIVENIILKKTKYTINLLDSKSNVISNDIGRIRISTQNKIAFVSGNDYKLSENINLWNNILEDSEIDLVAMIGNNVYADGVFYKVLNELSTNCDINNVVDTAFDAYHDLYYDAWTNNAVLRQIMSTTSIIMTPGNHDIFSLWGTGKIPHGYNENIFNAGLKIAKVIINKYQRSLMFEKNFPSKHNYYFVHTWGNIAMFCNEFRNNNCLKLDCEQYHEMIKFAKKSIKLGIKSFLCTSSTFLIPTNDKIVQFDNISTLIDIFIKSVSKSAMFANNCSFYFDTIFKIKKIFNNVTVICGNSNIFVEGQIFQNDIKTIPFYSASPITSLPINLLYPLSNTSSQAIGIAFDKKIGTYCHNNYIIRGDYNNVRNYVVANYDNNSCKIIVEKTWSLQIDFSQINSSYFTELVMDISNIGIGTLSEPMSSIDRLNYVRSQKVLTNNLSLLMQTLFT